MPVQDVLQNLYYENAILVIHNNIDHYSFRRSLFQNSWRILNLSRKVQSILLNNIHHHIKL